MTLSEYVALVQEEILEFQYWYLGQKAESFPRDLEPGEWREQFLAWVSTREDGGDD